MRASFPTSSVRRGVKEEISRVATISFVSQLVCILHPAFVWQFLPMATHASFRKFARNNSKIRLLLTSTKMRVLTLNLKPQRIHQFPQPPTVPCLKRKIPRESFIHRKEFLVVCQFLYPPLNCIQVLCASISALLQKQNFN